MLLQSLDAAQSQRGYATRIDGDRRQNSAFVTNSRMGEDRHASHCQPIFQRSAKQKLPMQGRSKGFASARAVQNPVEKPVESGAKAVDQQRTTACDAAFAGDFPVLGVSPCIALKQRATVQGIISTQRLYRIKNTYNRNNN